MQIAEGKRYGTITTVRFEKGKGWLCECDCGRTRHITGSLLHKYKKSCGHNCTLESIEGRRFGLLIAIEQAEGRKWRCQCSCGKEITAFRSQLIRRLVTSCGKQCPDRERRHDNTIQGCWLVHEQIDSTNLFRAECQHCHTIQAIPRRSLYRPCPSCLDRKPELFVKSRVGRWEIIWPYDSEGKFLCECVRCGDSRLLTKDDLLNRKPRCARCKEEK